MSKNDSDLGQQIAATAAKHGITLGPTQATQRKQDTENRRFIEERGVERKLRREAETKLRREIASQIITGVVGNGVENRFTETINEWLPKRIRDILRYGVDRRGVYMSEGST